MITITKIDQDFVVDPEKTYFVSNIDENIGIISPIQYYNCEKDDKGIATDGKFIFTLDTISVVDKGFTFEGKDIKNIHVKTFKDMYSCFKNYFAQVYPDIGFRNVLCSSGENRWT